MTRIREALWTAVAAATLALVCMLCVGAWRARDLPVRQLVNIFTTAIEHVDQVAQSADATVRSAKQLVDEARPKVNRALDGAAVTTENAALLTAHLRSDTMPLVNANLIHSDFVLGNAQRASEHQDEASQKFIAFLSHADSVAAHTDQLVTNPAIPSAIANVDRGTGRAADALDSTAKSADLFEKKLNQYLNPVRTAKQKFAAAAQRVGEIAFQVWLKVF